MVCAGSQGEETISPAAKPTLASQTSTTGTRHALVLFARFKGESTTVPSWAGDLFNPELPGSFSHFYDTMSFGKLKIRGEVALRVYESAQPASAYLSGNSTEQGQFGEFSLEILRQADENLDFAQFDNDGPDGVPNSGDDDGVVDAVFLVLASTPRHFLLGEATGIGTLGFEEKFISGDAGRRGESMRILPGRGTLQQGRSFAEAVGSMCHEYGHVLGLPDLYDTEFLKKQGAPPEEDAAGVGAWCLMGWGALGWNGDDGPNSFCAWSRLQLGWTEVAEVTREDQEIRLEEVGSSGRILEVPLSGLEYFLVENRRRSSYYDRQIPGEGLLVWHVRQIPPQVTAPEKTVVDLECADGRWRDAGYPLGKESDPQGGGDNLDFWAHDAAYAQAHGGNLGDATDLFDGVKYRAFTPQTNPSSHSEDGQLSVRLEGIRFEGEEAIVQVQANPLLVQLEGISIADADQDSIAVSGEEVRLFPTLVNRGGLSARQVGMRLHTDDPQLEILQAEISFGDLRIGARTRGARQGGLVVRFRDGFVGTRAGRLVAQIIANGIAVGQEEVQVWGVSPRQEVRQVVVLDSLGNGDGKAQVGEFIRLGLRIEVEKPELLRAFRFSLQALGEGVLRVSGSQLVWGAEGGQVRSMVSPEFLLRAGLEGRLGFELEARSSFGVWKDTLLVEMYPGPDQTPPRVLGLQSRSAGEELLLALPETGLLDGSEIRAARAVVYSLEDTSELATVSLEWRAGRYEGRWPAPPPGTYLVRAVVEDVAGNEGRSPVQEVSVLALPEGRAAPGSWEDLKLPGAGHRPAIETLVLAPGNPEVMYGATQEGIWRSEDGGNTWDRTSAMRGEGIMVDPLDPYCAYISSPAPRRSRDGGRTWELLDPGVELLAVDPAGRLYGSRAGQVVISADGGRSWDETPASGDLVLVHPAAPQVLYAAWLNRWDEALQQIAPILFRSADAGQTWERQNLEHLFGEMILDPWDPQGLYATSRDTLWHSADQGTQWEQVAVLGMANASNPVRLAAHPRAPGLLLAWSSYNREFWRSRDGGKSWEWDILAYYVNTLVLHPLDPDRFFLSVYNYRGPAPLLQTRDGGERWEELELPGVSPGAGTVVFDARGRLCAGATRRGTEGSLLPVFYTSENGEWEWQGTQQQGTGVYTYGLPLVEALFLDPFDPQLALAYVGSSLFRSADGGKTWEWVPWVWTFSDATYPVILAHPRQRGVYYLNRGSIFRSADAGQTWERRTGLLKLISLNPRLYQAVPFHGLVLDPLAPETLYAAVQDSVWRSADEGLNWAYAGRTGEGGQIQAMGIHPLAPQRLYAAATSGLYVSGDRGNGWTLLANPEHRGYPRMRLRFDPGDPERLLWVTGPQLLESRDRGKSWKSLGDELAGVPWFNDVAVDPLVPRLLYAATPWGVYRLDTGREITAVEEAGTVPQRFSLEPNYPNPFNPTTTIRFSLPQRGEVELAIYNLLGQKATTLVKGMQESGMRQVVWDGRDEQGRELASGVYLYRLQAGAEVETRKLLLLR
ncbi:MAG: immune inhibitor A [Candidatus Latescibacteria bacterium]|nr:immune inhibitor A [Candidatus Latescibacterota bacterium]